MYGYPTEFVIKSLGSHPTHFACSFISTPILPNMCALLHITKRRFNVLNSIWLEDLSVYFITEEGLWNPEIDSWKSRLHANCVVNHRKK